MGIEGALCGSNHEHLAGVVSLPAVAVVVIRNLAARADSILMVAPDVARDKGVHDRDSAEFSRKKARSPPQSCLKPSNGAVLKEPLLEEHRHGELMRRVVRCGPAIAAPVP